MSVSGRLHVPWGGVVGVIRRHHDDGEPTIELSDSSIREWLAAADRQPTAVELAPARVPVLSPSAPLLPLERRQVTVYRELDDDDRLTEQLLSHERDVHARANQMVEANDRRMERLLAVSAAAVQRSAARVAWVLEQVEKATFRRRRASIAPLVNQLGHLLVAEDVDQSTAARIMSLRSRYLSSPDDSQRLPRLTPERLAAMDAERGAA